MHTENSQEQITQCIRDISAKIKLLGLSSETSKNFEALADHLKSSGSIINPSFDPREHDIDRGFWLKIKNLDGEIVACHAERIFKTDDFVENTIRTGRLWWEKSPPSDPGTWRTEIIPTNQKIRGDVGYAGSMLIDKRYRKIGLSYYLPLLSRAICLADFKTDFHTGIVRESLAASIVPTQRYGFSKVEKIFRGVLPGVTGNPEDVFLCWMDRKEALDTIKREGTSKSMTIEKSR